MIRVRLKCQHCGRSLMDKNTFIDSRPSIRILARCGKRKGFLNLSAQYGSYTIESRIPVPSGRVIKAFCPHCKKELKSSRKCEKCAAAMVALAMQEGGMVQVCSRRGCKKHLFEFEDPEAEIRAFYSKYSTFFK